MVTLYGTYAKHEKNVACCCILTYGKIKKELVYTYSPELMPHFCLTATFRQGLNAITRPCDVELLTDCKRTVASFSEIAEEVDAITIKVHNDYAPNNLKKSFWIAANKMKSYTLNICQTDDPYIQMALKIARKRENDRPTITSLS